MNIEDMRTYLLSLDHVTEDLPFDETTLAFRIGNKIFALMGLEYDPPQINLKCDPERAEKLREEYQCVQPGYHMNKKHWNTLVMDVDATWSLFTELANHSYDLIYQSLPKSIKVSLQT